MLNNNDYLFYNDLLKNWRINLSEIGLRKFLIFVADDLRFKSYLKGCKEEHNSISRIAFLEVK